MIVYCVADNATGRIRVTGVCADGALYDQDVRDGEFVVGTQGAISTRHWYVDPLTREMRQRPLCTVQIDKLTVRADGVDMVRITGIPSPAPVSVRQPTAEVEVQTVTGGVLEYKTLKPGRHDIHVDCFPMQPADFVVLGTAP